MESDGILKMYQRSMRMHVWYNSSTYTTVNKSRHYNPVVFICKEECVNHGTNQTGNNLRRLIQEYEGKKLRGGKGIGGKEWLTNARVYVAQNFYATRKKQLWRKNFLMEQLPTDCYHVNKSIMFQLLNKSWFSNFITI